MTMKNIILGALIALSFAASAAVAVVDTVVRGRAALADLGLDKEV